MKKRKHFIVDFALLAVLGASSIAMADSSPPISDCVKYLSLSDTQFGALLSTTSTAQAVSSVLNGCLQYNTCSNMGSISNCATTLANRTFLSNYYAEFNPDSSDSASVVASLSNTSVNSQANVAVSAISSTSSPSNSLTSVSSTPAESSMASQQPANSTKTDSVQWF